MRSLNNMKKTERGEDPLPSEVIGRGGIGGEAEGAFTPAELEALRAAYAHGARGSLLVGLQRRRRLLTALLPPQPTEAAAALQAARAGARLRALRCDGYLHARRAHLSAWTAPWVVVEGMVAEGWTEGVRVRQAVPLDEEAPAPLHRADSPPLRDRVSLALEAAFVGERSAKEQE